MHVWGVTGVTWTPRSEKRKKICTRTEPVSSQPNPYIGPGTLSFPVNFVEHDSVGFNKYPDILGGTFEQTPLPGLHGWLLLLFSTGSWKSERC